MVPRRRLELPRHFCHRYLKPARLPIPPPGLRRRRLSPGDAQSQPAFAYCEGREALYICGLSDTRARDSGLICRRFRRCRQARPRGIREGKMAAGVITVFGGSGFIGRYVVQRLAQQGWTVRVAVRRPERCLFLKTMGVVGQVTPVAADVRSERGVAAGVEGADAVINLVGILYEKGGSNFQAIHVDGA